MGFEDDTAKFRACVRPLVIDSGVDEAPLGVWGTCFTAAHGPTIFAVTAAHLVRRNHSGEVRLLLSDRSMQRLPLSAGIGVLADTPEEEIDVIVYPASLVALAKNEVRRARVLNLTREFTQWQSRSYSSRWFVIGYPREHSEVDYEAGSVRAGQVILTGNYLGPATGSKHLHRLRVGGRHSLAEFAGFSGAPVFCAEYDIGVEPTFRFCGVAVAGSASSDIVHFVSAESVLKLMQTAVGHVRQFGIQLPTPVKGVTPNRRERKRRGKRV